MQGWTPEEILTFQIKQACQQRDKEKRLLPVIKIGVSFNDIKEKLPIIDN